MTRYSKFNIVYRLQKWMDSVPGQTFLNYAYSWGASVVVLGTLFKLTHVKGANFWMFLGMGTEVVVFFLSAFDRPFDKTEEGRDLAIHVGDDEPQEETNADESELTAQPAQPAIAAASGGGTIIIGGGGSGGGYAGEGQPAAATETAAQPQEGGQIVVGSPTWLQAQQGISPDMEEAQSNYVDELKKLTEMLSKVSEQSERLTRDSEEMENLNRTLTGICKIYEMQLKGASQQVGTIDQINEQTRKMAAQIEQLNKIYTRMIEAMTVNMRTAAPGVQLNNEE